ncbi:cytochrome P460 family protein [Marinibacterium profundimaris]|uniref:cytochrome P460 family protein n=1 Tax=Marinibacterium profundimaris TaxID=1679460 RepID=UPI000B5229DA|nr:cytochrome P460 family protein [Marinibacterium profundimaris]
MNNRLFAGILCFVFSSTPALAQSDAQDLPLPSDLPLLDYQAQLYPFIANRDFAKAGWRRDKAWRDTGPFVLGTSYGTHPAVRIYYSPQVIAWLEGGREGAIPDGAIVVKEMATPPAARYVEYRRTLEYLHPDDPAKVEDEMLKFLRGTGGLNWTVMVKDSAVSHGGWFFASVGQSAETDSFEPPFAPASGQAGDGMCMRCHASAAEELIFSALDNVEGYPGEPLIFRVDESWRNMDGFAPGPFNLPGVQRPAMGLSQSTLIRDLFHDDAAFDRSNAQAAPSPTAANPDFLRMFPPQGGIDIGPEQLQRLPSEWLDKVPSRPGDPQHFLTSDNCIGCHGGLGGPPSGTTMFLQTGPNYGDGYNISEYGEWRWSPMGLAGRDPIFFAQLESEFALLEQAGSGDLVANLGTTCLSCHGAMGQRQLAIDAHADPDAGRDPNDFKVAYTLLHAPLTAAEEQAQKADGTFAYHQYGNLAREGVSCAVCHHIAPPEQAEGQPDYNKLDTYLMNGTTGVFRLTDADRLIGPFDDVRPVPMQNAMGIKPVGDPYIKEAELCGACHTINLPNVDADPDTPLPGYTAEDQEIFNQAARNGAALQKATTGVTFPEPLTKFQHSVEQATYLEWSNSRFSEEGTKQTCQQCHMKPGFQSVDGTLDIPQITTQIATIQDRTLPAVENLLPHDEIDVPFRSDYRRHNFVGLNAFMVEMLSQFRAEMGLSHTDPMTYATNGAELTVDTMALQAAHETADVTLDLSPGYGGLVARVGVTNKTGHRLPSGVGFRRAFLEVRAVDQAGNTLWCSGCTNAVGVIVDGTGTPLRTEFLDVVPEGADTALYQPHYSVITDQTQVQIYEELTQNAEGAFTTSFVHRIHHPKDNRLTPMGALTPGTPAFTEKFGDSAVTAAFMKATIPEGRAAEDPGFRPGSHRLEYRMALPAGTDPARVTVTATLYYQAIPPYYLKQRFDTAPDGPATQRLYYLASRLKTEGTRIEDWKLATAQASASLQ